MVLAFRPSLFLQCVVLLTLMNATSSRAQWEDASENYLMSATAQSSWLGTGMSAADFDLDGLEDLTFANSDGSVVAYKQWPQGGFSEWHSFPGGGQAQGVVWFDVDGDEDLDLLLTRRLAPMELYVNEGGGLVEAAEEHGLPISDEWEARGVAVADYDADGDLDLYICMYHDGTSGQSENLLLNNDGFGNFTDVTAEAGVGNGLKQSFQAVWFDEDGDGDLDLWVVNDRVVYPNALYRNEGDGTFVDVSAITGVDITINGMSATIGDPDNDGDWELFCTDVENVPNILLDRQGAYYIPVETDWGIAGLNYSWGGCWVDADGDMWSDLMVATNRWPNATPYDNYFYRNLTGGQFEDVSEEQWPNEQTQLFCLAVCDVDQDLAPDVVGFGNMPAAQVLRNTTANGTDPPGRLAVQLCGTVSNRLAVGAVITVHAGGLAQKQCVSAGSDFMTQQSWRKYFGLGDVEMVDSVVVDWPSGLHEVWTDVPPGSDLRLVEGSATATLVVDGTPCPGDSVWLHAPFDAPVVKVNGQDIGDEGFLLASSGNYVVECEWLGGLFSWSDTLVWTIAAPHVVTLEWTEPACHGEPGILGWVTDSELTVWLEGEEFAPFEQDLAQVGGWFELETHSGQSGCVQAHSFFLPQPPELNLYLEYTHPDCHEDPAVAYAVGYGGTPGYLVNWNGLDPNDLPAGEVLISLTDAQGCTLDSSFTVVIPDALGFGLTVVDEDVGNDGAIVLDIFGGSPPYDILWNTGLQGEWMLEGLSTGLYSWVISDAQGCVLLGLQEIVNMDVEGLDGLEWSSMEWTEQGWLLTASGQAGEGMEIHVLDLSGRLVLKAPVVAEGSTLLPKADIPAHGIVLLLDEGGIVLGRTRY